MSKISQDDGCVVVVVDGDDEVSPHLFFPSVRAVAFVRSRHTMGRRGRRTPNSGTSLCHTEKYTN